MIRSTYLVAGFAVALSFQLWRIPLLGSSNPSLRSGPHIEADTSLIDFGRMPVDTVREYTYKILNTGTSRLAILSAIPSCGCTAALLSDSLVAPGQATELRVRFDSHLKAPGPVWKTVALRSNDPLNPTLYLKFHAVLFKDTVEAHRTMAGEMHLNGIFEGDCASCHVEKGKGLTGMSLYQADCAVCHGSQLESKPAPDISSPAMMRHTARDWVRIIEAGIPGSNMPAFSRVDSGPLTDAQINSIAEYLGQYKSALSSREQR